MTVLLLKDKEVWGKQLLLHPSSQTARGLSGESPTPTAPRHASSSRFEPSPILTDFLRATDSPSNTIQGITTPETGRVPVISPITAHFRRDTVRTAIVVNVLVDIFLGCGNRNKGQQDGEESCSEEGEVDNYYSCSSSSLLVRLLVPFIVRFAVLKSDWFCIGKCWKFILDERRRTV